MLKRVGIVIAGWLALASMQAPPPSPPARIQLQVENRGVPPFNHGRADTLASMDRYERIARNLQARTIIQHEPADIAKLPLFPEAAE